ncbi:hypothetical protein N0V88_001726 [Collariella sp. IMI 366227]|nr:hypothetical protein N0V88_001726 [Collariella sp. IMI 366227]
MSTNTRSKRTVRAGDLTMPLAPSQAGQPSRATRSGSRPSSSSNKRKRGTDKDDLFGSDVFGDGHLFCSECLHSALNIDPSRRICPICRQKIDNLPQSGKFTSKNKGFYPLELKLMTRQTIGRSTNTLQASQSAQNGRES